MRGKTEIVRRVSIMSVRRGRGARLPVEAAKRVPILEVARRLGLGEPEARGRELAVRCPLHHDHDPSCYLNPQRNLWHCFVCGEGGDGIRLMQRAKGISFEEAVRQLIR